MPYQRRYHAIEKESLAIKWAALHFRHYLYSHKFHVETDHKPLKALFNAPPKNSRIAQWRNELLLEFGGFDIQYRPGYANGNADGLSRAPNHEPEEDAPEEPEATLEEQLKDVRLVAALTTTHQADIPWEQLAERQFRDENLRPMMEYLSQDIYPTDEKVYKLVVTTAPMYALENGVLYVNPSRGRSERMRVVVPQTMVPEVLRLKHEGTFAGHPGVNRTYSSLEREYFWKGMRADVQKYVAGCADCQTRKEAPKDQDDVP